MHNNIMAAGSKERPPMLGPGRYSQWHSRFLRYLDTKSNGEYLRKCIFKDELHQFDKLKVWELVDKPFGKMIIKLKWLWKNKKGEDQTEEVLLLSQKGSLIQIHPKSLPYRKALYGLKQAPRCLHFQTMNSLLMLILGKSTSGGIMVPCDKLVVGCQRKETKLHSRSSAEAEYVGYLQVEINTEYQLADIVYESLSLSGSMYLVRRIGMRMLDSSGMNWRFDQ
ncbi:hypothetical protein Tco_0716496 [Tanacetum coccineum]